MQTVAIVVKEYAYYLKGRTTRKSEFIHIYNCH